MPRRRRLELRLCGRHLTDGLYVLPGLIEGGPNQIVHGGICDGEMAIFVFFDGDYTRQKNACVGDEATTWFEYDVQFTVTEMFVHHLGVGNWVECCLALIRHSQTAAQVQVFQ